MSGNTRGRRKRKNNYNNRVAKAGRGRWSGDEMTNVQMRGVTGGGEAGGEAVRT